MAYENFGKIKVPPFLPHEFRHLKLVEIPITTVLVLIKTWLTYSLTHALTHALRKDGGKPL